MSLLKEGYLFLQTLLVYYESIDIFYGLSLITDTSQGCALSSWVPKISKPLKSKGHAEDISLVQKLIKIFPGCSRTKVSHQGWPGTARAQPCILRKSNKSMCSSLLMLSIVPLKLILRFLLTVPQSLKRC